MVGEAYLINFSVLSMKNLSSRHILIGCALCSVFALAGCAMEPRRNYIAQTGDAELQLRSVGMPMNVVYSISTSEVACEGFENTGAVRDSGEKVLLPWIVKMSSALNRVPTTLDTWAPANTTIQVKGYSSWQGNMGRSSCGPVTKKFTTRAGGKYKVEFLWEGVRRCSMQVSDLSTDPPAPIDSETLDCHPAGVF